MISGIENRYFPAKQVRISILIIIFMLASASVATSTKIPKYSLVNSNVWWFVLISDAHIGADERDLIPALKPIAGCSDRLRWALNDAYHVYSPQSIINLGDLTDQLTVNIPNIGQWNEYWGIVNSAGVVTKVQGAPIYADVPGNHDQYYSDAPPDPLINYLDYSASGALFNKQRHASWPVTTRYGEYLFVTTNTTNSRMTQPSVDMENWCPGSIDGDELLFILNTVKQSKADLIFTFGHHPVAKGSWGTVVEGRDKFINILSRYSVSMYAYGHTHAIDYIEPYFSNRTLFLNVKSLCTDNQYSLVAIDNNGISVTDAVANEWPVVLITAPTDKYLGHGNPYTNTYTVHPSDSNPVRALVFCDPNYATILSVKLSIDGTDVGIMNPVSGNEHLWEGYFDASSLSLNKEHKILVSAECALLSNYVPPNIVVGSNTITVEVKAGEPGKMTGKVHAGTSAGPGLADATVECGRQSTSTSRHGNFSLSNIPSGFQKVTFSKPGFLPFSLIASIPPGQAYNAGDLWLQPQ
jgi:hypothetical protein